jgi:hypothetical protein
MNGEFNLKENIITHETDLNVFATTVFYTLNTKHVPIEVYPSNYDIRLSEDGNSQYFWNISENFLEYTKTLIFDVNGEQQGWEFIKHQK